LFGGANSIAQATEAASVSAAKVWDAATEWLSYGGDKASSKYSPLAQISGDNFHRLKTVGTWKSAEEEVTKANFLKTWAWESTPLMVGDVLYLSTSLSQVAALNAATGKTLWVYDPETWKNGTPSNNGFVHRGVTYWVEGKDRRILFGTGDGYLICLNAATGKPISTFGREGRIDLTKGLGRSVDRHLYGVSSRRSSVAMSSSWVRRSMTFHLLRRCRPATCEASTFAPACCSGLSIPSPDTESSGTRPGRMVPGKRRVRPTFGR
jgi:glucose dehydrogenase